ncbi:MAG: zinc-binding dehydrogenase [Ktedonobacterales bacterium]
MPVIVALHSPSHGRRDASCAQSVANRTVTLPGTTRFEEVVHSVDVAFDTVGGDTLARSWQVVKAEGDLVSVVSPSPATQAPQHGVRLVWFVVEPNREHLRTIGALLDAGQIRPIVAQVFPLAEARRAFEEGAKGHARQNRPRRQRIQLAGAAPMNDNGRLEDGRDSVIECGETRVYLHLCFGCD